MKNGRGRVNSVRVIWRSGRGRGDGMRGDRKRSDKERGHRKSGDKER